MVEDQSESGPKSNKTLEPVNGPTENESSAEKNKESLKAPNSPEIENSEEDDKKFEQHDQKKKQPEQKDDQMEQEMEQEQEDDEEVDMQVGADSVKETHEDDDIESSQSLKLVLEDTEGDDDDKKLSDDKEGGAKKQQVTGGKRVISNGKEGKEKEKEEQKEIEVKSANALPKELKKLKKVKEKATELLELYTTKVYTDEKEVNKKTKKLPGDELAVLDIMNEKTSEVEMMNPLKKLIEKKSINNKENEKMKSEVSLKREEQKLSQVEVSPVEKSEMGEFVKSEIGIVNLVTKEGELLIEEVPEMKKPALPTDDTKAAASDRVVRWVANNAAKADDPPGRVGAETDNVEKKSDNVKRVVALKEGDEARTVVRDPRTRGRRSKQTNGTNGGKGPSTRKSQKVVTSIIRRSIRCLNKMHAMESNTGSGKKSLDTVSESKPIAEDEDLCKSPKVPQSQQNGAALPEETASADRNLIHCLPSSAFPKKEKKDPNPENDSDQQQQVLFSKSSKLQYDQTGTATTTISSQSTAKQCRTGSQRGAAAKHYHQQQHQQQNDRRETRKRRSVDPNLGAASTGCLGLSANGNSTPKKICLDQREQFINSLVGSDKFTAEQLTVRAEQLRAEVQDLDELARAKEMEWNEILSMRKLKEEAYLRIERRRQIVGFMEGNGPVTGDGFLPPANLVLGQQGYEVASHTKKTLVVPKDERDTSPTLKRERAWKAQGPYQQSSKHHIVTENGPKQIIDAQSPENRQIGEGRQGPIVDVRSIIADYRLRHPETVPRRRGRRMRNSVNVGLGAGGAVVETVGNIDSRPSSTDSCKSNSNVNDPNNAMSFKDVLVQFAKLSQQQGEPIKTPQNYPDVTLHPVAAAPPSQNSSPQTSGSLLHGILTKSQSPRPTTFSPTLARLLTAPERERNTPTIMANPHQTATQHLLQAYQGANPVSISDFLSSSKARTEITITPVVNNSMQTHSNNLIHVEDIQEETSVIEERDSRLSIGNRDNRDDRDSPPRCQGCHERAAQFVCAGCGNQWYCSRECQVAAWDEHSEVCSG